MSDPVIHVSLRRSEVEALLFAIEQSHDATPEIFDAKRRAHRVLTAALDRVEKKAGRRRAPTT